MFDLANQLYTFHFLETAVNSSTTFNIASTFLEGLLSFAAPCVLPLVPGYLSFVCGSSVIHKTSDAVETTPVFATAMADGGGVATVGQPQISSNSIEKVEAAPTNQIIGRILTFIGGFTVAFVVLFGIYDALTTVFGDFKPLVQVLAGILVIIFGLHFMGVFRLPFLNIERRFHLQKQPASYVGAFALGFAFAFGWSPCVGPFLTTAITQASNGGTASFGGSALPGVALMIIYSAGLGVPFLLAGLFVNRFLKFMARIRRHFQLIEFASGLLLILVGILIITGNLTALSAQFNSVGL